jgi:hypothetical protein
MVCSEAKTPQGKGDGNTAAAMSNTFKQMASGKTARATPPRRARRASTPSNERLERHHPRFNLSSRSYESWRYPRARASSPHLRREAQRFFDVPEVDVIEHIESSG